jgi:hypothetical protein
MISRTHPHHLTASRPPLRGLRWWDVVNTTTLSERFAINLKENVSSQLTCLAAILKKSIKGNVF